MITKQNLLRMLIALVAGQLVALAIYFIWDERAFVLMVFASFGMLVPTWIKERNERRQKAS